MYIRPCFLVLDSTVKNKMCELWNDYQSELEEISHREKIEEVPIMQELEKLLLEKFTDPNAKGKFGRSGETVCWQSIKIIDYY